MNRDILKYKLNWYQYEKKNLQNFLNTFFTKILNNLIQQNGDKEEYFIPKK